MDPSVFYNTSMFLILIFLSNPIQSEIFTATNDIEKLIDSEINLYNEVDSYIKKQQDSLAQMRNLLDNVKSKMEKVGLKGYEQGKHPLAIYFLVKRFLTNWKAVGNRIQKEATFKDKFLETFAHYNSTFPNLKDLEGSANGLSRLQEVYQLNRNDLLDGKINGGSHLGIKFNWFDCFTIGLASYKGRYFQQSYEWMKIVYNSKDPTISSNQRIRALNYLASSAYRINKIQEAINLTQTLLKLNPEHKTAKKYLNIYEKRLNTSTKEKSTEDLDDDNDDEKDFKQIFNSYKELCRGNVNQKTGADVKLNNQLNCYQDYRNPRLLFSPLNVEVLSLQPYIVIYHNLLTNSEVVLLKTLASPLLKRAVVVGKPDKEYGEETTYRISKTAWLDKEDHPAVKRITTLIGDIIGLTSETAEPLQIANYGIGGHYEPHLDFIESEDKEALSEYTSRIGNRIATVLIYLSNVEAGGATVFPKAGVRVEPRQGSAAFWYNMHRNGEGNKLSVHAACPVLIGSKWAANLWFREVGQELRHTCTLNPDE
ncbi:Prolyl 4-hydroxylase subunit alpha-2 [Trichoplax sp. H2]|nr:Prolyl 4-hydroxylase subunit alpha-2 [Trichoplax sp. H2]|eukprot:RDD40076.1 Prolyl 4-hydroxylase subunit alpha-2 [Trichoplax sp. H2]